MLCTFSDSPFAEGRFRSAYKGIYTEPQKKGQPCVVKENKDSYTWKSTDWDMAVNLQTKAKELAQQFNKESNCTCSITYTDITVGHVTKSPAGRPKLNEYIVVEDYIPGIFVKWCSNYGYISPQSELMPAFMHWSWIHTKGKLMIADLQGVRIDTTYRLTDPVLLSNSIGNEYGCTDTGVEGMAMFFLKHTCNQFCQGLPKPTIGDVVTNTSVAQLQLDLLNSSTSYVHELKFPEEVRQKMTTVFPKVARRNY